MGVTEVFVLEGSELRHREMMQHIQGHRRSARTCIQDLPGALWGVGVGSLNTKAGVLSAFPPLSGGRFILEARGHCQEGFQAELGQILQTGSEEK